MAVRDELVALLREKLGAGFGTALLPALLKEYTLRTLAPELKARRVAALDTSALVSARRAAEAALRTEEQARAEAVAVSNANVDAELRTV